jgi:hypothetical protein
MWHGWLAGWQRDKSGCATAVLIEDEQRRKERWSRRKVRLRSKRKEEAATANGA